MVRWRRLVREERREAVWEGRFWVQVVQSMLVGVVGGGFAEVCVVAAGRGGCLVVGLWLGSEDGALLSNGMGEPDIDVEARPGFVLGAVSFDCIVSSCVRP